MQGRFISFEGTEGVGKTTAIDQLCARLTERGIEVLRTREPGGSELAEALRTMFLDPVRHIDADAEILMMFAARADHIHKTILPALQAGKWVICDRFVDSTVAYQGFGRYEGDTTALNKIELLIEHFVPVMPEVTLWLDLDVVTGMQRAGKRGALDRLESNNIAFFERVHRGLEYQFARHGERIHRIDASGKIDEVAARIDAALGI
ncbi:dTMP kinase [Moraxella porci DSM 25326]|uniref:Thymidylate kinase n=1 Tax=Moraxella porci DSM 25326 TaxID=573983 RepID=A0A1T0CQA7_9GAMM|nr:dTMP kinase [Moraxella porci]OOS24527.1 dTMP kinase [Moraxella porci DSM 25326]